MNARLVTRVPRCMQARRVTSVNDNIISINIANAVSITIMAAGGALLAGLLMKAVNGRRGVPTAVNITNTLPA